MHPGGCKWCNIELITIQDCGIFPGEFPNQNGQNIESLGRLGYESLLCQAHVCAPWVAQNVMLCKVKSNLMSDLNFQPKT